MVSSAIKDAETRTTREDDRRTKDVAIPITERAERHSAKEDNRH